MPSLGSAARKPYRIEGHGRAEPDLSGAERHREVMQALAHLQRLIEPGQDLTQAVVEANRSDLADLQTLKGELDAISSSIQRTREEIATLHYAATDGREMARVTDELGAVVEGTACATNTILEAAERVDELAGNLSSRLSGRDAEMASEVSDQVVRIFEACNFQDITGQRISKVVGAMRFIEERVGRMVEIWGGLESLREIAPAQSPTMEGEAALLNGPALPGDPTQSQDDVDALFD